ncbi:reverse transcriptase domain-containing protein [Emticicia fluvialis]|uniref:reverse transcriptase domain-containing protein n=1 Tax=Emticicia fluvialis TaxID=2974474 RepID=UPI002165D74D|nr:reverse transcriptase domain-containing protein [Emticicia fluvialis]
MAKLKRESFEWALIHLTSFYDSDFYPLLFEFKAIKHDWNNILPVLLEIDIDTYAPKMPFISAAPKSDGSCRVVHQLDPIDSLIYTALAYEHALNIEAARIPVERHIAFSYRINPDTKGSFFDTNRNGYGLFLNKAEELAGEKKEGYVLMTDLVDFYNQIYLHRVSNILEEAGSINCKDFEKFLLGLNNNISKGIPVGPAPSIIISEAILSDIDNKIIRHNESFVRYADDIYIFFSDKIAAQRFLSNLTLYLHSNHRLVLSSEKTRIITTVEFLEKHLKIEDVLEKQRLHSKLREIQSDIYPLPEKQPAFEELDNNEKFKLRAEIYKELFLESISFEKIDLGLMRHILRQAGNYKIRIIIPLIFKHFDTLIPVLREIVSFFLKVLNEKTAKRFEEEFSLLLEKPYLSDSFINIWIFTLFQDDSFNNTNIKIDYNKVNRIRERALIAKRSHDKTWVKDIKDGIDTLGPWDKRAVIDSAIVLSKDECLHWLGLIASKGELVEKSICAKVISDKKAE